MAKRKFPITPIGICYICDKCGKGLAMATDSEPTPGGMFRHVCNACNYECFLPEKFPTIAWEFPTLSNLPKEETPADEKAQVIKDQPGQEAELCEVSDHGRSPVTGRLIASELSPD